MKKTISIISAAALMGTLAITAAADGIGVAANYDRFVGQDCNHKYNCDNTYLAEVTGHYVDQNTSAWLPIGTPHYATVTGESYGNVEYGNLDSATAAVRASAPQVKVSLTEGTQEVWATLPPRYLRPGAPVTSSRPTTASRT